MGGVRSTVEPGCGALEAPGMILQTEVEHYLVFPTQKVRAVQDATAPKNVKQLCCWVSSTTKLGINKRVAYKMEVVVFNEGASIRMRSGYAAARKCYSPVMCHHMGQVVTYF